MTTPPPVRTEDLSSDGVHLVSPDAPEFDSLAAPLIGSHAPRVLKMKPALVLVRNDSARTIVAASLTWRASKRIGTDRHRTNSKFPHVIVGDTEVSCSSRERRGVLPGEHLLVAMGCVVEDLDASDQDHSWIDHFIAERDRMVSEAVDITIALDAVIFDDGTLVGPDEGQWLRQMFQTYVTEKQRWYTIVRDALRDGSTVDDAFAPIRAFQEEHRSPGRQIMRDPNLLWRVQAAAEVASWRRRFPDGQISDSFAALTLEPFAVR